MRLTSIVVALAIHVVACSSGSNSGPMDASGGDGLRSDGSTDTGIACTTITNAAPTVTQTLGTSPAPAPAGGVIVSGTYQETAVTFFVTSSSSSCTGRTLVGETGTILATATSAATGILEEVDTTGTAAETRGRFPYTTTGTTLSLQIACVTQGTVAANSGTLTDSFTATPTEIRVFSEDKILSSSSAVIVCGTRMVVLTRQ